MKLKINPGAIIDTPGSTEKLKGVTFRDFKPVTDYSKCTKCAKCWTYCPDMAFLQTKEGYFKNIDQNCKGCGICAKECPVKCIKMEETK